jgi:hypothetical protein
MFVGQETILDMPYPAARARLASLARAGWLDTASGQAYSDGRAATIRVGPFGPVLGASKLVRVRLVEPAAHDHIAVLPLRWEATGPAGRLFPVLDADITLMPAGEQTKLALTGSYRPPLDGIGATLDKIALHHLATATISSLLRQIAHALTHEHPPAPQLRQL